MCSHDLWIEPNLCMLLKLCVECMTLVEGIECTRAWCVCVLSPHDSDSDRQRFTFAGMIIGNKSQSATTKS